jgi:hypothetical protein
VTKHVTSQATSYVTKHVIQRDSDYVTSSVASKVKADDSSWIPSTYRDFLDIFSKKKAEMLLSHRLTDHAIHLELGTKLPYGQIYSLFWAELRALKAYHDGDSLLRLCTDYRALNYALVKNRYPLPLMSEILERIGKAKTFMKLNLGGYNLIRIKEGDQFRTAFRTRYGQFEYRVMRFGLTHAPATFQAVYGGLRRPLHHQYPHIFGRSSAPRGSRDQA